MVEAKLEVHGLLSLLGILVLSRALESVGLLLVSLRGVLGKQFKELGSYN